jgi:hypothetical protein
MKIGFDTTQLIGKRFRYRSKYGVSEWTDTVSDVVAMHGIEFDKPWPWFKISADGEKCDAEHTKIIGYHYRLHVRATRTKHIYEFENCIFLNDEE